MAWAGRVQAKADSGGHDQGPARAPGEGSPSTVPVGGPPAGGSRVEAPACVAGTLAECDRPASGYGHTVPPAQARRGQCRRARRSRSSNLDKLMYPRAGFTKGHVIDYYTRIAPVLLPHLRARPLTLKRYPNGVEDKFFYEKRCPSHRPEWVRTAPVWSGRNEGDIDFCLCEDLPTLVWLANLADLELHTPMARAPEMDSPTMIAFDLDPGPPATIVECAQVALDLRMAFEHLGLEAFPKTSGSKGMQVYLPLNTPTTYADDARVLARARAAARAPLAGPGRLGHEQGQARRQGVRGLEPERPPQDDGQRLLAAGDGTADGIDAAELGRGVGRGGRGAVLVHIRRGARCGWRSWATCSPRSRRWSRSCRASRSSAGASDRSSTGPARCPRRSP